MAISLFVSPLHVSAQVIDLENIIEVTDTLDLSIITRLVWGCSDVDPESDSYCYDPDWYSFRNPVSHIVIHHTVTTNTADDWSKEVRYVWNLHAIKNGWNDIGYNYLIDPNGVIYEGRYGGEGITGGHVYMHNIGTVGIAMIGTYNTEGYSSAAIMSLKNLLITLFTRYKIEPTEIIADYNGTVMARLSGHRDWDNTECPGDDGYISISSIRNEIEAQILKIKNETYLPASCPSGYTNTGGACKKYNITKGYTSDFPQLNNLFIDSNKNLYVSAYDSSYIYKIDSSGNKSLLTDLVYSSSALFYKATGNILLVTQYDTNQVLGINLSNNQIYKYADTGDGPRDIAMDVYGNIYVANVNDNSVTKIGANGTTSTIDILGKYPISITSDTKGNVYTANYLSDSISKIYPDGYVKEFKVTGILPTDLAVDSKDNVYSINEGTGNITKLSLSEEIENFIELYYQGNAIAIDNRDNIYVTHPEKDAISKVTLTNDIQVFNNIGETPVDIVSSTDGKIYTANMDGGNITSISLNSESVNQTRPVYRFFSKINGAHLYTISTDERSSVLLQTGNWNYEGDKFYVFDEKADNNVAVYRFFNKQNGAHIYTISEEEKNNIINTLPNFSFEGVKFYVYSNPTEGSKPVYRFFNKKNGAHIYTINENEKNSIESLPDFEYEGIKFYVL